MVVGAINAIFIIYSVRSTYEMAKKENSNLIFKKLILINHLFKKIYYTFYYSDYQITTQ